ncbi:MAG: hypothetical protein KDC18_11695 [Alphaproteobacteria bacterium]|nr:hypothetical protein [Alphaproteobacteria bacterium]MCB9929507.1 hypothetical protein [Alphaproteobacteria bacterium]
MNRSLLIPAALLLALSACKTVEPPMPAVAPAGTAVVAPASDVPAQMAAFSGTWRGKWQRVLDALLVVETVSPTGQVQATYAWADALNWSIHAGSTRLKGQITGNTLQLEPLPDGGKIHYVMRPDGSLDGHYVWGGGPTEGHFVRQ